MRLAPRSASGLLAVLVMAVVAGCGSASAGSSAPPAPLPSRPTVESVSWHLAHVSGRHVTVHWRSSGTCNPSVPAKPRIDVIETSSIVTITVQVHVVKVDRHGNCVGVGLGGTLHTMLTRPVAGRKIAHGTVTDHGA